MGKWDFLAPYDTQVQAALETGDVKQAFEVLLQGYQAIVVQYCTALLRTWVFRIARNLCLNYRTKRF